MLTPDSPADEDMLLPYRAMAYNNAWANCRVLRACAQLSQNEFTAQPTGFFPSLRATLNHIANIDRFYVDAMERGNLGPAACTDPEPCAANMSEYMAVRPAPIIEAPVTMPMQPPSPKPLTANPIQPPAAIHYNHPGASQPRPTPCKPGLPQDSAVQRVAGQSVIQHAGGSNPA